MQGCCDTGSQLSIFESIAFEILLSHLSQIYIITQIVTNCKKKIIIDRYLSQKEQVQLQSLEALYSEVCLQSKNPSSIF